MGTEVSTSAAVAPSEGSPRGSTGTVARSAGRQEVPGSCEEIAAETAEPAAKNNNPNFDASRKSKSWKY